MSQQILLNAFNQGGLSDSKYSGIKNSFARMIGWDIHSVPGLLQVNQAMAKVSSTIVTAFCKVAVDCSNGIRYWFSSTDGKIWQEKAGTFTLVYTVAPNAGGANILGAAEYAGFLYFFTQSRGHRIPIDGAKADGATAWTNNIVANWAELNLDQATIGGIGATAYSLTAALNEGATHKQTFVVTNNVIESVRIKVLVKGTTADWTLEVHDAANTVIATKTLTNANVSVGLNYFEFASPVFLTPGTTYHIHVYGTNTTGTPTVDTDVATDLEGAQMSIFTTSSATSHPTKEVNLVLYLGDKQYVHQIDASTSGETAVFSTAAVDLPVGYIITALGEMNTDLLIGANLSTNVNKSKIFKWNTFSDSFTNSDTVFEPGINCFLEADNYVIVSAGLVGNLYSYNGDQLLFYKKIPGTYSPTAQCIIYPNATALFKGFLPIFGVSNSTGDPCDEGVYSLGRHSNNYPTVLNLEFPISQIDGSGYNRVSGIKIGAIIVSGQDVYMSWEYNGTFGIDKLDYSNKIAQPIIETRIMSPLLGAFTTFNKFYATYDQVGSGTSMIIKYSKNGAAYATDLTFVKDTDRNQYLMDGGRLDARFFQVRYEAICSGNNSPSIQEFIIDVE